MAPGRSNPILSAIMVGALTLASVTAEEQGSFNKLFSQVLKGTQISLRIASKGMTVPLNSLLVTLPLSQQAKQMEKEESLTTISFPRQELNPDFISSLFREGAGESGLPFAQRGIESILTPEELRVTVHRGVFLHLRNDLPGTAGAKVFRSDDVMGQLEEVRGKAFVSTDTEIIRERFKDIWAGYHGVNLPSVPCILGQNCFIKPDGTVSIQLSIDIEQLKDVPRFYPPRVEE